MNTTTPQTLSPEQQAQKLQRAQRAVNALYPAAVLASQLRGMGIRMTADTSALNDLLALRQAEGSLELDVVLGNLFHTGSSEIRAKAAEAATDPRLP